MDTSYKLDDLESDDPKVKYGMQKRILELAEREPEKAYKDFDFFVGLLDNENNIMVWTGLLVLGYLSKVDKKSKIDQVLPQIIGKLNAGKMITAGNTIKSLTEICKNRPDLADGIVTEILKVKQYKYDSEECSHIAIGHALKNIKPILGLLSEETKQAVLKFAQSEINNPRPATAKKARELLEKLSSK